MFESQIKVAFTGPDTGCCRVRFNILEINDPSLH